ncbi:MAG: F420-nonreducing hydrogenase, partial [Desulfamplus sp.]|nr:F420-nonreducing hydrogenase [Desulfamplus sp.]
LFAQYTIEMDKKIRELGPNPVKVALQAKKQAA